MLNWGHKGRDGVKRNIGGRKCRECPPGLGLGLGMPLGTQV